MLTEFRVFQRSDNQIGMLGKSNRKLRAFVIPNKATLIQTILDLGKKTSEIAPVWFDKDGLESVIGLPPRWNRDEHSQTLRYAQGI